uniref:Uncharacterized protein n=1 Tax=Aegilops tauschii TaxID=37682 RepID=M8C9L5_AEGTA
MSAPAPSLSPFVGGCDLRAPVPPYQLGLAGRTRRNVRDTWLSFEEDTSASKLQSAPCCWKKFRVQDAKNFGWEINGDINYNWKKLLENKHKGSMGIQQQQDDHDSINCKLQLDPEQMHTNLHLVLSLADSKEALCKAPRCMVLASDERRLFDIGYTNHHCELLSLL